MLLVLIRVLDGPAWATLGVVWCFAPVVVMLLALRARSESAAEPSVRAERRLTWKLACLAWTSMYLVFGMWLAAAWNAPPWVPFALYAVVTGLTVWLLAIAWPRLGRRRRADRSSRPSGELR